VDKLWIVSSKVQKNLPFKYLPINSMTNSNQLWGAYGEQLSSAYLQRHGYRILATNWRCHHQEIDLIAQQQSTLVLVEVKLRLTANFGLAVDALTKYKIKQLNKAVNYLLQIYHPLNWRYDFIAIDLNLVKRLARLCHYRQII
jgi:putative endonuclease